MHTLKITTAVEADVMNIINKGINNPFIFYFLSINQYSKLSQINKLGGFMFTKLKKIVEPKELNKYMEKKEFSPKQQWLRDNTPAKIQTCISDLKYWGLI